MRQYQWKSNALAEVYQRGLIVVSAPNVESARAKVRLAARKQFHRSYGKDGQPEYDPGSGFCAMSLESDLKAEPEVGDVVFIFGQQ